MSTSSLKKRYTAKLFANLVGLAINMVTQAIIPRGLGPKAYGDFHFLSSFFSPLMSFFTFNTSIGFYTKLSQRQNEFGIISFYFQFTGLAFLVLFAFVGCSQLLGITKILWPDQRIHYVYMGALYASLFWVAMLMIQMADAYGITVSTEMARIAQKCFGLVIVVVLFLTHQLILEIFFLYHYIILLFLILTTAWIMARSGHSLLQIWHLNKQQIKGYIREFYEYSHPLFLAALFAMVIGILDRWLLQRFSGSVQQGFFGLANQISATCFLFTSAMTALITREFSIAYGKNDLKEMAILFRRYIPLLYSIAAFFSCFVCIQAENITYIFGGAQFAGAALPVAIMALYPVHQTYGQLTGAVFFATGQTKLYRNVGILLTPLSLALTYFLLAPVDKLGLNAGATGLCIKFVIIQLISVNVLLFYSARLLNLRFLKYFGHQALCPSCLLAIAFFAARLIDWIVALHNENIISFLLSGVLYSLMVMVLVYVQPLIFGLRRDDVKVLTNIGLKIVKRA